MIKAIIRKFNKLDKLYRIMFIVVSILNIVGIKASFVLSRQENQISISGRSLGEINVQLILEKLGGGGSMTIAGAQIIDSTEEEVIEKLKQAIKEYKETK